MKIVVISGKQGSGKTTTAELVAQRLGQFPNYFVNHLTFASIIYEMHDAVRAIGEKYGIEKNGPKDGLLLQILGTEWGRKTLGQDVWVKAVDKKIQSIAAEYISKDQLFNGPEKNMVFIVSDCRMKNEFDAFPMALRVRLACNEETRQSRCPAWRANTYHPSEIDLDDYESEGKFDVVYRSDILNAQEISTMLASKILRA